MVERKGKDGMFSGPTDFSMHRTAKQAIGFYIVYVVAFVLLGALIGFTISVYYTLAGQYSMTVNSIIAIVVSIITGICLSAIGLLVLTRRKLYDAGSFFIVFVGLVLAVFIGNFIGFILIAYLTMKDAK